MYICIPSQLKDFMMHVHIRANGRVGTYICNETIGKDDYDCSRK